MFITISTYNSLLTKSKRQPLLFSRNFNIAVQVFKSLNDLSPPYLHNLFVKKQMPYDMRDASLLIQPKVNTVSYGLLSIRYHGPKIWNSLSHEIKQTETLKEFKYRLKKNTNELCDCSFCFMQSHK